MAKAAKKAPTKTEILNGIAATSDVPKKDVIKVIDAFKDADIKNLPAFMEPPASDSSK